MLRFMTTQYPSKLFMPALGVQRGTLHGWAERRYIKLGKPGTGQSVILTGQEVLFAACLVLLSRAGHSPKQMQLSGLEECIAFFHANLKQYFPTNLKSIYAVFRFVDYRNGIVDAEWELMENPIEQKYHVVEAHGDKAEPYLAAINLYELTQNLILKIEGRKV